MSLRYVLLISLTLTGSLACPSGEKIYNPCPDPRLDGGGAIGLTGLCECDEGARFVDRSVSCALCDSQGSPKPNKNVSMVSELETACLCKDGAHAETYINTKTAKCVQCPTQQDCALLECTPPGCDDAKCTQKNCPQGSTCDSTGHCQPCSPGMCGGTCGSCENGMQCILSPFQEQAACVPSAKCCLDKALGDGTKWCLIDFAAIYYSGAPPPFPGNPCCCNATGFSVSCGPYGCEYSCLDGFKSYKGSYCQ